MSTLAINNTITNNKQNNRMTLVERLKKYILENSATLAASEQLILGSSASIRDFAEAKKN